MTVAQSTKNHGLAIQQIEKASTIIVEIERRKCLGIFNPL